MDQIGERRGDLSGGGAGGASIWFQDVCTKPSTGEIPKGFPPLGYMEDGMYGPKISTKLYMGVPIHWGGDGDCGYGGD